MKENLENCKEWLECKRFDILHLWIKSIQLKEMNRILDSMYIIVLKGSHDLQKVHEKVTGLMNQKSYLLASRTLVAAEKTIYGVDLTDIGALDNLKEDFKSLKEVNECLIQQLKLILIEELQIHIYLKSPTSWARKDQGILKLIHTRNTKPRRYSPNRRGVNGWFSRNNKE